MPPSVATIVFVVGILGLFVLDRDRLAQPSKALWLPVIWLLIIGSRPVSEWLQMSSPINSPDQYLEGSPVDRLVFIILLVAGLIALISRVSQVRKFLSSNGLIILFFTYCAVSTLWSDYPGVAFKRWIKAISELVMVLIVLTDSQPNAALKRLLARVSFLLLPVSVLFIKYYPDLGRGYDNGSPMWTGVTTNKNSLGLICMILGLGAIWRLFQDIRADGEQYRLRRIIAQCALLMTAVWLLAKVNSVSSLACFLMAGTLIALMSLFHLGRKPAVVHLVVLGMVSLSLFSLLILPDLGLVKILGRDPTLTGRTEVWHTILNMTVNPLVGAGFESFWLGPRVDRLWNIYWWHPNEAHNGYIEVYLNLGWIGLALLGVIVIKQYRNVVARISHDPYASSLKLAYIFAGVIYSLTEAGFRLLNPVWFFFLLSIVAIPDPPVVEDPKIEEQLPQSRFSGDLPLKKELVDW